ncbi:MAG: enoyl-CoA hydratase-related protein [Kiloniellales bacterium]
MSDAVRSERRGAVLEITLDRPKANAIDSLTSRALAEAFLSLQNDPELRVAIITGGGGKFFSAGWDLKAAAAGQETLDGDYGPGGFAGLTELFELDKPVIAAINGLAVGGGFELALASDMIVAAEHAEFFLPEINLGIIANGGGVLRLPQRIPQAIAMEMLLTGRRMGAKEAAHWGLVNLMVPASDLMATARKMAAQVAAAAPLSIRATKEVVRATRQLSVEEGYAVMNGGGLEVYERMLASEDAKEGARAFAEKREPVWRGA